MLIIASALWLSFRMALSLLNDEIMSLENVGRCRWNFRLSFFILDIFYKWKIFINVDLDIFLAFGLNLSANSLLCELIKYFVNILHSLHHVDGRTLSKHFLSHSIHTLQLIFQPTTRASDDDEKRVLSFISNFLISTHWPLWCFISL